MPSPAIATMKPASRNNVVERAPQTRSRVTNGKRMFLDGDIDQRSPVARRFRDLVQLHTADAGGAEHLSEAQAQLIRRIAMLETQLEVLEGRMVAGDDSVDLEEFARVSSHLRRMIETLGLRRVARDVTPTTLADIVARHRPSAAVERVDENLATGIVARPISRTDHGDAPHIEAAE